MIPDKGKWYYVEYGFEMVVAQCEVSKLSSGASVMLFRWGNPWRTPQLVHSWQILGEASDPRLITRVLRGVRSAALAMGMHFSADV